ncbi:hypothetical protein LS71_002965 [Helicobacter jaachi]|uniref:Capsule biosynthesis protein n=1 Tax=Helicobacter jaachi TaxID=1677920 RepID=A0A4U8TCM6_9HELI|nr:hypothetical protein [Helicobacter jaachi]TLD97711.1 hypothetical protein LS71_002965 [Helicobacter jaachi]
MNNIILLDRDGKFLRYILEYQPNIDVCVLVCEYHYPQVSSLIKQHKSRITHVLDYMNLPALKDVESIDYALIAKMKHIQIDIETMLHRIMLNNPLAKDIYHQHLSFFSHIFSTQKIDCVICAEMLLGTPNHLVPFGLAKMLNIPSYTLLGINDIIFTHNYNTDIFLSHKKCNVSILERNLFYDYITYGDTSSTLKSRIRHFVRKIGGQILVEFIVHLKKFNFTSDKLGIPYNFFTKFASFLKYKKMLAYYKKHSTIASFEEKFIYYSLHLEPEAAIIGRTVFESQLTAIRMLSKALPKGWKLYVKEHPHQFMLNDELTTYFMHNIEFFKNIEFYKQIQNVPNTVLLSLELPSKSILPKCQAVASFDGTITLESINFKKPAILFNPNPSPYKYLANTLPIQSYKDVQIAVQKIQEGYGTHIEPKAEMEKLARYVLDSTQPSFYQDTFLAMKEHALSFAKDK